MGVKSLGNSVLVHCSVSRMEGAEGQVLGCRKLMQVTDSFRNCRWEFWGR